MTEGRADGPRARTVFLGSGHFGVESLRRLAVHPDVLLVGVVSAPARPAGRHGRLTATDIETTARALGVPTILTPKRLRLPDAITSVLELEPELAVLVDYGQLVPSAILELPHGALNLHPSLLPRHRGAIPIPAAILADDRVTGVTLMRMDAGLDTGPIVAQRQVRLTGTETGPSLQAILEGMASTLLAEMLPRWLRGGSVTHPQPADGATMTRPLRRADGRLDPDRPAIELERQIRAYQPWPGSYLDTTVGRLTVWSAGVGPDQDRAPGRFGRAGLGTSVGELLLHEVQPAGGGRMSWADFVRGRPGIVGSAVVPGP